MIARLFLLGLSIALLTLTTYYAGLTRGRWEGREGRSAPTDATVAPTDAPMVERTCWSSEPDYASGVELELAEERIQELERQLASAATRMHYQTSRAEAVTPDGRIATLAVTADGRPVDELQFVDADIARAFSGCVYLTGTPTQVQLARELWRVRDVWGQVAGRGADIIPHVQCPSCETWTFAGDARPCPGCGGESPWVLAMRAIVAPPPQEPRAWQDPDNPPPTEGHR